MSHDFCRQPRTAAVPVSCSLDEACQDILRKRQISKQPRRLGVLLSFVWTVNAALALILAFLVGFCMGESQSTDSSSSGPSLRASPRAAQALPSSSAAPPGDLKQGRSILSLDWIKHQ